jgi:hypothetical protein
MSAFSVAARNAMRAAVLNAISELSTAVVRAVVDGRLHVDHRIARKHALAMVSWTPLSTAG